ncbi:MAG TPA: lysophospholipid acyltransferase family protein [Chitinophagaceae bacterium]|nr:lysophospholipid acyltransferase family protein [Chitinophagaceae bacterium]
MPVLLKPLRFLYVCYALVLFVLFMIPAFLWSLVVLPFGRIRSGNLIYHACMLWGDVWFFMLFLRHQNIYEQPLQPGASYIFVANHISYMDTPTIVKAIRQPVRPLGKVEMIKLPLFGFIYKNVIVTVDRSSLANRVKSVQVLKSVLRKGVSVLVFPEGTFNTTGKPLADFYDGAFRIAIETGQPIKPVLFLDGYDRLHYSSILTFNPGRNRCVFLESIPTTGYTIREVKQLKETVHQIMWQKLVEYNASWIQEPI